jgi:hypothetical protein
MRRYGASAKVRATERLQIRTQSMEKENSTRNVKLKEAQDQIALLTRVNQACIGP